MKTYEKCLSCFQRQTSDACAICGLNKTQKDAVLQAVQNKINSFSHSHSPVEMAVEIHELVRSVSGIEDPYSDIKMETNRVCRECAPLLHEQMKWSLNPMATAIQMAIAGNILDFGAYEPVRVVKRDISRIVQDVLENPLIGNSVPEFAEEIRRAGKILYVADNAGECFFDSLLIDVIGPEKTVYAVRGGPVLNDATMEDARAAGITEKCRVVDTGDNAPGIILKRCSSRFRKSFTESDLIISKGQGNYESLSEITAKNLLFLTKVKCEVIARDIGYPVSSNVIKIINSSGKKRNGAEKEVCHA